MRTTCLHLQGRRRLPWRRAAVQLFASLSQTFARFGFVLFVVKLSGAEDGGGGDVDGKRRCKIRTTSSSKTEQNKTCPPRMRIPEEHICHKLCSSWRPLPALATAFNTINYGINYGIDSFSSPPPGMKMKMRTMKNDVCFMAWVLYCPARCTTVQKAGFCLDGKPMPKAHRVPLKVASLRGSVSSSVVPSPGKLGRPITKPQPFKASAEGPKGTQQRKEHLF